MLYPRVRKPRAYSAVMQTTDSQISGIYALYTGPPLLPQFASNTSAMVVPSHPSSFPSPTSHSLLPAFPHLPHPSSVLELRTSAPSSLLTACFQAQLQDLLFVTLPHPQGNQKRQELHRQLKDPEVSLTGFPFLSCPYCFKEQLILFL